MVNRMKYRCPYCGEESFGFIEKAGYWVGIGRYEHSIHLAKCSFCKKRVGWLLGKTNQWGHLLFINVIPLVATFIGGYILSQNSKDSIKAIIFLACIPLWVSIWFSLNYFFCHFDKARKVEREADARIKMSVPLEQRLWPGVREGEIYRIRCPKRGTAETAPHLFVLVADRKKAGGHRELDLRVIKAVDMALPYPDEPIWLITRGKDVIEGTTLSTTLAKEIPERR